MFLRAGYQTCSVKFPEYGREGIRDNRVPWRETSSRTREHETLDHVRRNFNRTGYRKGQFKAYDYGDLDLC